MLIGHRTCAFLPCLACWLPLGCGATPPSSGEDPPQSARTFAEDLQTDALGNALSRAEVRIVLKLVDDACGDTWCEGDYDFRFRHLFCDSGAQTCLLSFQMALRDGADSPKWRWRTCRTGFLGFDSLVTTSGGYQWLADGYYQALTACIDRWEKADAADP
jgi:hypothetical protein